MVIDFFEFAWETFTGACQYFWDALGNKLVVAIVVGLLLLIYWLLKKLSYDNYHYCPAQFQHIVESI